MLLDHVNFRRFITTFAVAAVLFPCLSAAQTTQMRVPLSTITVAKAMQAAGVTASESQIDLPFRVETLTAQPAIMVTAAETLNGAHVRVRLACSDPHECLPFFAVIHYTNQIAANKAAASFISSSSERMLPIRGIGVPALRPGDRAVLLLEDKQMQILLPVLSIDAGKVGSSVRVSSLDRKKTFVATIVDSQTLRGTLP